MVFTPAFNQPVLIVDPILYDQPMWAVNLEDLKISQLRYDPCW